jgi:hypothetical protein
VTRVVDMANPARGEDANEFRGLHHGAGVSFIVVEAPPGGGPRLHRHPILLLPRLSSEAL